MPSPHADRRPDDRLSGRSPRQRRAFTFEPDTDFLGTASFNYKLEDDQGNDDWSVTVTINVGGYPPIADTGDGGTGGITVVDDDNDGFGTIHLDGTGSTDPDGTIVAYNWSSHDVDPPLSIDSATGQVAVAVGEEPYFHLKVTDDDGLTQTRGVRYYIVNENDAPTAATDSYTTNEDTPLNVSAPGLLDNDTDPDPQLLTAKLQIKPLLGNVALNRDGSFDYLPQPGFHGTDSFTYTVFDGELHSAPATVTITVTEDAAGNQPPVADAGSDQSVTDSDADDKESVTLDGAGSSDPDGSIASYSWSDGGTLLATGATPTLNLAVGTHTLTLTVTDDDGATASDTVTITVTDPNDAPVATDDSYATDEDTPLSVAAPGVLDNDSDADGDPLTAGSASAPAHGSVTLNNDGSFTYTPAADYHGSDSFTYTASDGAGGTDTATVNITVNDVNDAPTADAGADQTVADTDNDGSEDVTLDGAGSSDPDGSIASSSWSEGGTQLATGATPTLNLAVGTHTLTLTVTDDDGATASDTVTITVTDPNDAPVATDDSYATDEDTPLSVAAPGVLDNDSDADGDPLTAGSASAPAHGSVTLNNDGSFTYTPAADYHGSDSFTYTVSDGAGGTDTATVKITVNDVNDAPVANAGADQTVVDGDGDGSADVTLDGAGSSDPDGSIASSTWSEGGTQLATGATPTLNLAVGTHTLTLTVTDDDGATDSDTVTVEIAADTVPPTIIATTVTITGTAPSGADSVTAGGVTAPVGPDGTFTLTIPTAEGQHVVTLTATGPGLNETRAIELDVDHDIPSGTQ